MSDLQVSDSGHLIDRFLSAQRLKGMSENTVQRRRWTLTTFADQIAPQAFAEATTDDVEEFLGVRRSMATRRALLSDLRMFYRWAVRRGVLTSDPTEPVESPKVPKRAPTPLTRDELRRAWEAADFRMRCIIALGARAGLRVSEIAALDASDVDHERRVLVVRQGKGGKDRIVPLSLHLSALLENAGPGAIVGYKNGDSVSAAVREHFQRLGINKRPHDLRATFATEAAAKANGDVLAVQQLLGHESPATSMRYISYGSPNGRELVERLYEDEGPGHLTLVS